MELLHKKIKNGEYSLGETFVPQTFTKTFVKDGKIKSEEISVSGRKFSLIQICKDLLQKHSHYMRLTTNEEFSKMEKKDLIEVLKNIGEFDAKENEKSFEDLLAKVKKFERTRYFACWHDGSSVGNHNHLFVTVNVLYDTASFLSDNEYYLKHKKKIIVQASVEEPNMYILARCPSTDQQLLYTDERIGDIMNLKYPRKSSNNVEANDVLRFFKGDSPACQFEVGQQKGGNFFCVVCPVHANHVKNIAGSNIKKSCQ